MACYNPVDGEFPDIWEWIHSLAPPSDWKGDAMSLNLCKCSQVSLLLSATRKQKKDELVTFSLLADLHQLSIPLWTSEPCRLRLHSKDESLYSLFLSFIEGILQYAPQNYSIAKIERRLDQGAVEGSKNFKQMFNCAFLCMAICVCFYEAPYDIRAWCMEAVEGALEKAVSGGQRPKLLLQPLGSNIEEQVMRSMGLVMTSRMFGAMKDPQSLAWQGSNMRNRVPFPCCYSSSPGNGLWKLRVYMPVVAMKYFDKHSNLKDDSLLKALSYLHLEAVLQLSYKLIFTPDWIEVQLAVDNVRCDVVPLAEELGLSEEKHFPSRITIRVGPEQESKVLTASLEMSSANPSIEMSTEKTFEAGIEPPNSYVVLKVSATEVFTVTHTPWQLEQSVEGSHGTFDWTLYDIGTGKEVWSSKPSKVERLQPKAWFKDRYSSVLRPFTRQGGVVFARDKYPQAISWKVKPELEGQVMRWEVGGSISLTYWPNKYRTFYCETRHVDFSEQVDLPLIRSAL